MEEAQEVQESETAVYCLDATGFVLNALTHTLHSSWEFGTLSDWKSEVKYLFFFDDIYCVISWYYKIETSAISCEDFWDNF